MFTRNQKSSVCSKVNAAFRAEYYSRGTPGFTLLVNLVIEGAVGTIPAGTCAESHFVHLPLNATCRLVLFSSLTILCRFLAFPTLLNAKAALGITTGESFFTATLCVTCGCTFFYKDLSTYTYEEN